MFPVDGIPEVVEVLGEPGGIAGSKRPVAEEQRRHARALPCCCGVLTAPKTPVPLPPAAGPGLPARLRRARMGLRRKRSVKLSITHRICARGVAQNEIAQAHESRTPDIGGF